MHLELMPAAGNVIRFPIERRVAVSIQLLFDIAPDYREVANVAEAFGFEQPDPQLYDRADRSMAEALLSLGLPGVAAARRRIVDESIRPLMDAAMAAIDAAGVAGRRSEQAQHHLYETLTIRGLADPAVEDRADRLATQAARTLLEAHERVQWALGAWRAADMARRGVDWTPRDRTAENDWLWQSKAMEV